MYNKQGEAMITIRESFYHYSIYTVIKWIYDLKLPDVLMK